MDENTKIKIFFFGTSAFAVPALEALIQNAYTPVSVVTNPDEPAGRKRLLTPPPIKILAEQHGIRIFQPEKLDDARFVSEIPRADLFIVAAYGKIIPASMLAMPKFGALNIHPSLLPRYRGPSPIQSAILSGDPETGVTIMQMDERMDHGPIVARSKIQMANGKLTYPILHDRLAELGAHLLIETLPRWINGAITPTPQDDARATYCKLLTKDDGRIDWTKSAEELERMVRAFQPWPGTWTVWESGSKRIKIEAASWIADAIPEGILGQVWHNTQNPLLIQSGRGSLTIKRLGIEGKKIVDVEQFLHGHPSIIGAVLP